MNESVKQNNPNERVEKMVAESMQMYNDLSSDEQIVMGTLLKRNMVEHRLRMISDCKSDLEAVEFRLKSLYCGLEELQMEIRHDVAPSKPSY